MKTEKQFAPHASALVGGLIVGVALVAALIAMYWYFVHGAK
jgi:hypothetical protein